MTSKKGGKGVNNSQKGGGGESEKEGGGKKKKCIAGKEKSSERKGRTFSRLQVDLKKKNSSRMVKAWGKKRA